MQYKGSTYQKRTSHQNEDTIVSRRLSVDGVGAMLDLLEWQGWGIATRRRYDDVTWKSRESVWAFAVTARHRWASLVGHALVLVRSRPDLEPRAVIFFQARRACSSTPERHRRPTSSFVQLAVVSVALISYRSLCMRQMLLRSIKRAA
ncbi:hypothetical protein IG631_00097 [Alternaria alternata]|nr:hypothetical protein IG631_00097 [Alternaria alternata]